MIADLPPSRKILVIEDDALTRDVLCELLEHLGHAVIPAAGGPEGLERLEAEPADLVLTDLNMPEMTGWEVVKVVKARWPRLLVGVITGRPDVLAEQRQPVDLAMTKPVTLAGLRHAISGVL